MDSDEGPGPPIKYQYADLGKLYHVVSVLVRCCDVSSKTMSSVPRNTRPSNNPFAEECSEYLMPIQTQVSDILFYKTNYVKKNYRRGEYSRRHNQIVKVLFVGKPALFIYCFD